MEEKTKQFNLLMSLSEHSTLDRLAQLDSCSKAAVIRRLVKREARVRGVGTDVREVAQCQPAQS